jgi:hypothetical protein
LVFCVVFCSKAPPAGDDSSDDSSDYSSFDSSGAGAESAGDRPQGKSDVVQSRQDGGFYPPAAVSHRTRERQRGNWTQGPSHAAGGEHRGYIEVARYATTKLQQKKEDVAR